MKNIALIGLFITAAVFLVFAAWMQGGSEDKGEIAIKTVEPFAYCCIHHVGPFTEIENIINQVFPAFQQQGISPMGGMIGVYYNSPAEVSETELEWEVGFPVSPTVTPNEPLIKKKWDYTKVAAAIHKGPYEETGKTVDKMLNWITANGMKMAGPMLEKYLDMPTPETDPSTLRTEIWIPVK